MQVIPTSIPEVILFEPKIFKDHRGYFYESYNSESLAQIGIKSTFVQDNQSKSTKGVLRGLHFQTGIAAQAKLVRVLEGEVLDVAVDIRQDSPTFGKHVSAILSAENNRQMFIPRGFAHGFVVLSETAIFSYKVDNLYAPTHDSGILWNDETLNIDWNIDSALIQLSEKDKNLSSFKDFNSPF